MRSIAKLCRMVEIPWWKSNWIEEKPDFGIFLRRRRNKVEDDLRYESENTVGNSIRFFDIHFVDGICWRKLRTVCLYEYRLNFLYVFACELIGLVGEQYFLFGILHLEWANLKTPFLPTFKYNAHQVFIIISLDRFFVQRLDLFMPSFESTQSDTTGQQSAKEKPTQSENWMWNRLKSFCFCVASTLTTEQVYETSMQSLDCVKRAIFHITRVQFRLKKGGREKIITIYLFLVWSVEFFQILDEMQISNAFKLWSREVRAEKDQRWKYFSPFWFLLIFNRFFSFLIDFIFSLSMIPLFSWFSFFSSCLFDKRLQVSSVHGSICYSHMADLLLYSNRPFHSTSRPNTLDSHSTVNHNKCASL